MPCGRYNRMWVTVPKARSQFDRGLHPPVLPPINLQLAPVSHLRWYQRLNPPTFVVRHLPAVPSTNFRLASDIASFGGASDQPLTLIVLCVLRLDFPIVLRLAPPTDSPTMPSNSTSESPRLLHLRLRLPASLRLAPPTDPPALPSNSTSGSHRLLSSPALLSCQPPTCVGDQPSSLAFELNLRLSRLSHPPAPPSD